jgi:hypothetical protein
MNWIVLEATHSAHRMRYQHFRELGMFIGLDAGCKAIVVQRAKQSGMHWTTAGAAVSMQRCSPSSGALGPGLLV